MRDNISQGTQIKTWPNAKYGKNRMFLVSSTGYKEHLENCCLFSLESRSVSTKNTFFNGNRSAQEVALNITHNEVELFLMFLPNLESCLPSPIQTAGQVVNTCVLLLVENSFLLSVSHNCGWTGFSSQPFFFSFPSPGKKKNSQPYGICSDHMGE